MQKSMFMLRLHFGYAQCERSASRNRIKSGNYYRKVVVIILFLPLLVSSQSLHEKLLQCPVTIEKGKINYYMPQQNGAYYQLPPARKPQYVNIFTVPWVLPLVKSVKDTQNEVLAELVLKSKQTNLVLADKSLFMRKLAWCVMMQPSVAKTIDKALTDFIMELTNDKNEEIKSAAILVDKLIADYINTKNH